TFVDITVTNISDAPIGAPLWAYVVPSSSDVMVGETAFDSKTGKYYVILSTLAGIEKLSPGQSVTFPVIFERAQDVRFGYEMEVWGMK
ncbi:MAG: hypothetical protein DRH12_17165, partial [Deltaproteobacteria bacterium]